MLRIAGMVIILMTASGCFQQHDFSEKDGILMQRPNGFPNMDIPDDNSFTESRWLLGKRLFFEKKMSKNNTISCASCHRQEFAFSDSVSFSDGDLGAAGTSNAPTLSNIGYHPYYLRGGSVPTLEMQILVPIQEHNEFNSSILEIAEKLNNDSSYRKMSVAAYNREIDPFVITRALACFERSIISGNTRFDKYYYDNEKTLSRKELNGMRLFYSEKANCSACHGGFNFTNYKFENNGLYANYKNSGRIRFTRLEKDRDKFKVPTLRNIAFTSPYMHDGSIKTLEMVIEHYNSGGVSHPNKSKLIKPLNLSENEKKDLVAFLKTLSDYQLINDKNFKND